MAGIWTAALVITFIYVLKQLLLLINNNGKKLPPGPFGLPIIGHFHLFGKKPHLDLCRLARKYGPIMSIRLGLAPVVVISSPAGAEHILKTHDVVFANRPYSEAAKYILYGQRDVVFGRYGPSWRNLRKLCTTELMTQLRINQFSSMRRAELNLVVDSLKRANRGVVDVSLKVSGLSVDMTCLMVFGRKFDDKDLDDEGFKSVVEETLHLCGVLNLGDYFPYVGLLDLQGLTRRMKRVSKILDVFLENIIRDLAMNKNEMNQAKAFVDIMIDMLESGEAGLEFDRGNVKAVLLPVDVGVIIRNNRDTDVIQLFSRGVNVNIRLHLKRLWKGEDMLIAGMDTTATTVEWTLSEIMRHPNVMKKLQQELEEVVGLEHMVEESHLDRLPYLYCVLKETLRLHPIVPLTLRESMENCQIDGLHIPAKSRILVNSWAIGRDPSVWHDAELFSPERFIDSDIDLRGRHFELLPFGAGRRGCAGMQLGLVIVRLVLAQLLHCFDWELPNGMSPNDLDMSEHVGLVITRASHFMAMPTYRLLK